MEMNKGEAEKCRDLGKKFLRSGEYARAVKFFDKSLKLYPLPGVEGMRDRAAAGGTSGGNSNKQHSSSREGLHQRKATTSSATPPTTDTRNYTPEQAQIVRKIKGCKNHYEVLDIPRVADENAIKKAYRKLALRLHPDKNSAPGAEDAFKAVGKAFSTLSDADKRAHYDRYGEDDDTPSSSSRGSNNGGQYSEDINPEDIFNMFFGGHGFQRSMYNRRQQAPSQGGRPVPRSGLGQFLQFLPLFIIFIMSMFSIPGEERYPFSMHQTMQFPYEKFTNTAGVYRGLRYFVSRDFESRYRHDWESRSRLEVQVERSHVTRLSAACDRQKQKQRRMLNSAKNAYYESDRENALKQARGLSMSSCNKLQEIYDYHR